MAPTHYRVSNCEDRDAVRILDCSSSPYFSLSYQIHASNPQPNSQCDFEVQWHAKEHQKILRHSCRAIVEGNIYDAIIGSAKSGDDHRRWHSLADDIVPV